MREIVSLERSRLALAGIQSWPGYAVSPLHVLPGFAEKCNVRQVFYKDESQRFGLKSFKALGGSYAVAQQLLREIANVTGDTPTMDELFRKKYSAIVSKLTVATATDGNHGRSVAWGAQLFGCACVIYIHADVSASREKSMADLGADVIRVSGNYDDSVREVAAAAAKNDWIVISDNSYPGYLDIPKDVMAGYTVMLSETLDQLAGEIPTHIFIQGGCGGLAASVCGYFWEYWGVQRPRLIIVEPEQANCLQRSAMAGEMTVVDGKLDTLMAGLACGEVSLLAWEILKTGADDFLTLPERVVPVCMRVLAQGVGPDPALEAGESAVAGIGALLASSDDESARAALGLTSESSVLVFGTEGATDAELYKKLIG
jgi:diaminopropionate ammonia-lyase